MLADGLNKGAASRKALLTALMKGVWHVAHETERKLSRFIILIGNDENKQTDLCLWPRRRRDGQKRTVLDHQSIQILLLNILLVICFGSMFSALVRRIPRCGLPRTFSPPLPPLPLPQLAFGAMAPASAVLAGLHSENRDLLRTTFSCR